jgi:hypothetical protein
MRALLALSPRQAGLGVASPQATAISGHAASVKSTGRLATSLKAGAPLDTTTYAEAAAQSRRACRKARVKAKVYVLESLCAGMSPLVATPTEEVPRDGGVDYCHARPAQRD